MRNNSLLFVASIALLVMPLMVGAAYDDAQFDGAGDTALITLSIGTYTVIGAVESVEVSTDSFILTLVANSSINIYSSARHTFGVTNPDDAVVTFTCEASQSRLRVVANGSHTVTVTPSGTACGSSGSNSGGGGGGGGSPPPSTPTPAPMAVTTTTATTTVTSTTPPPTPTPAPTPTPSPTPTPTPSPSPTAQSPSFFRDLELGATGEDVRDLQKFLNGKGFKITEEGPGSPGNETTKFGSLTKKALAAFQAANGISPASGYFGPRTRTAIESAPAPTTPSPSPVAPSPSPSSPAVMLDRDLTKGMSGNDVRQLQIWLNSDPDTRITESGAGSPGNETDLFGGLTVAAVKKFQAKYGISQVGKVGPATRAKLTELFGGANSPAPAPSPTPTATPPSASTEPTTADLQAQLANLLLIFQALQQQAAGQ